MSRVLAEITPSPVEYVPANIVERVLFTAIFDTPRPVEIDIGCGDGSFLAQRAAQHPDRNFLGIERLLGRVRRSCRRAERLGLGNVRVLRLESAYALEHVLPLGCVEVIHVSFPDPWPKRRHHRRRLVNAAFLDALHATLSPGGELRLSTDDAPYFTWMQSVSAGRADFAAEDWHPGADYPQTAFERIFRSEGLPIYRLRLRKV